ncbi:integrase arm-type DNA-binding domain-containing protein [Salmonella enterica]
MKLTARQIETAKPKDKAYKLSDGGGLYLEISPRGSKYWRMKYRRPADKRENRLAFGIYPIVTLAEARTKRDEAKKLLAQGIDPRDEQKSRQSEDCGAFLFETIARQWHASNLTWGDDHRQRVLDSLEKYIFPAIGEMDARKLRTSQLLAPIKAVDASGKHDVAQRLQQRVTAIMRYGVQNDIIESNPAVDMAGALVMVKAKHHPALPPSRFHEFMKRIEYYKGRRLTRLALELTLLTFVRSSEIRFSRWNEVNFEKAEWIIPGRREPIPGVKHSERGMKMKTDHIIPLSRQALGVLGQLHALSGRGDVMFPSDHDPKKVMSENTINNALRVMGYDTKKEVCGHGFRTMARGALGESKLWNDDAIERQLSHIERRKSKAAYLHTSEYIEERRLMLQWWADYLDANREKTISPYDFAKLHNGEK